MALTQFIKDGEVAAASPGSPLPVSSVLSSDSAVSSVANATTSGTLLAANAARKGATIYNDATGANLFVKLGSGASLTSFSLRLVATGYYEVPYGYTGVITAVSSAAEGTARITELV